MSDHVFQLKSDKILIKQRAEFVEHFPPGIYNIDANMDGVYFTRLTLVSDEIIPVKNSPTEEIITDINHFMKQEVQNKYKEYGFVHKRGILMHGKGGTGKSTTITQIANRIVSNGGIVFFNANPKLLAMSLHLIRENTPDAIIGVIYEEFDEWINSNTSAMLSFLDGELQVDNVIFLGATNYITKIPERIKNRPSRFAKVIELTAPDEEFRREFFKRKLKGEDLARLEEFVKVTEGMVVDQLKDIVISVCCVGASLPDAVNKLKGMQENGVGVDDYSEAYVARELKEFSKGLGRLQRDLGLAAITVPLFSTEYESDRKDESET